MFKKLVANLERKLLGKYLQYKINQFLEVVMLQRVKAEVKISGVEISFKDGAKDIPIKTAKMGEISISNEHFQDNTLEEMERSCELLPGVLKSVSTILREELLQWDETINNLNDTQHKRTEKVIEESLQDIRQQMAELKTKLNIA